MHPLRPASLLLSALLLGGCAAVPQQPHTAVHDTDEPAANRAVDALQQHHPDSLPNPGIVTDATDSDDSTNDLWEQMRGGFAMESASNQRVAREIRNYTRSPQQIEKVFTRAAPYMAYILGEVEQRGFPTSLALLPFVESGYDPFAYSQGRAAGLWQFIPGTGKQFGLEQDWWYDGRRDIVASTRAALDYLGALHDEFDGDWLLALAAYNAGNGTVRTAIERNRSEGKPADYWHLRLPQETTDYVPRLLAIREIVRAPDHYGVILTPIEPTPAFAVVDIDSQIDLGIAARLAGMSTDDLLQLNPGYNRLTTHPDGPHQLAIPVERLDAFTSNLENLPEEKRAGRGLIHKVRSGDTLSQIASRYRTTVAALQQGNQLRSSNIRIGQELRIDGVDSAPVQLAASQQQLAEAPGKQATPLKHTVRKGDNLWTIASLYQVSVSQLRRWNRIPDSGVIRPGQQLVLQDSSPFTASTSQNRTIRYTVLRGDTLSGIAQKYTVTVQQLRKWNKLSSNRHLQPGQVLLVQVRTTEIARN